MILIVGHITSENKQEFFEAEAKLRAAGYLVENPAQRIATVYLNDKDHVLRYYIENLANCTKVHLISNWHTMHGASIIQSIIKTLNIPHYA